MDITLGDLLELEPRLVRAPGFGAAGTDPAALEREVSWAVTARGTPPHLPQLRGGEIIVLPERVVEAVGRELRALLRETAARGASAVLLDAGVSVLDDESAAGSSPPRLEWATPLGADTETAVNRLLTECRGDLYRIGSELERSLTDAAVAGSGLGALLGAVSRATGLPLRARDASGRLLAAAGDDRREDRAAGEALAGTLAERRVAGNAVLEIGPAVPPRSIVARFFADRIAAAAAAAMQRDDAARPRGTRRLEAVSALLSAKAASASEPQSLAVSLGLDPEGAYLVVASRDTSEGEVTRAVAPLGRVLPAGSSQGLRMTVVALADRSSGDSLALRVRDVKRRWADEHRDTGATLALSARARGVANLPAAAQEARLVAEVQRRAGGAPRASAFDSVADVGALRLLFQFRESEALRQFVAEALGPLAAEDQRGTLRETLRAYLDSGGSHVETAERLGIHRNTLTYRLRRIAEIMGRDVTDPASWLTLHLALCAADVLDICGDRP